MSDYYLFPEQIYNKGNFEGLIFQTNDGVNLIFQNSSAVNLIDVKYYLQDLTGQKILNLLQYPSGVYLTQLGSNLLQLLLLSQGYPSTNNLGSNLLQLLLLSQGYPSTNNYGYHNLILWLLLVSFITTQYGIGMIKTASYVDVQGANYISKSTSKASYKLTHVEKDY